VTDFCTGVDGTLSRHNVGASVVGLEVLVETLWFFWDTVGDKNTVMDD
jgi:hypothetical protein